MIRVNVEVNASLSKIIFIVINVISALGMLLLWFEYSKFISLGIMPFFSVLVSTWLFTLSQVDTMFIPKQFRTSVRTLGTIMMLVSIDGAACAAHKYHKFGEQLQHTNARNLLRTGAIFVLMGNCAAFLMSYFHRKPNLSGIIRSGYVSILGAVQVVMILLLLAAQITVWSMRHVCEVPQTLSINASPAHFFLVFFMLISAVFFEDREAFDLTFVLITPSILTYVPLFKTVTWPHQSNFEDLWRAEYALAFIVGILMLLCSILMGVSSKKISLRATAVTRLKTPNTIVQVILFVVGIVAAVCVYARSPQRDQHTTITLDMKLHNYWVSFAMAIPLMSLFGHIFDLDVLNLVTLMYSHHLTGIFTQLINSDSPIGYLRAGYVLSVVVMFLSPVVTIFLRKEMSLKPIDEIFKSVGDSLSQRIIMATLLFFYISAATFSNQGYMDLLFAGVVLYLGQECDYPDVHRLLYFWLSLDLFGVVWPLTTSTDVLISLRFLVSGWYVMHYTSRYLSKPFIAIDNSLPADVSLEEGLIEKDNYERIDKDKECKEPESDYKGVDIEEYEVHGNERTSLVHDEGEKHETTEGGTFSE